MREELIRQNCTQGAVFYTPELNHDSTNQDPHYIVVLNADPGSQSLVILTVGTTRHTKVGAIVAAAGFSPRTIAFIKATDCEILTKDTTFNCNEFQVLEFDAFVSTVSTGRVNYKGVIEVSNLETLLTATKLSTKLSPKERGLLE